MKKFIGLLSLSMICMGSFLIAEEAPAVTGKACACKDCKCTVNSHCGCKRNQGCSCGPHSSCGIDSNDGE